jgi:hypothetical protein
MVAKPAGELTCSKGFILFIVARNAPEPRPFAAGHLLAGQILFLTNIGNDGSREPIIERRFLLVSRWNE